MSTNRGQRAITKVLQAPIGGLNAIDALAAMPETDASVMLNMMPFADRIENRAGTTINATASTVTATSTYEGFRRIMRHVGGGAEKLFGAYVLYESVAGTPRTRLYIYEISGGTATLSTSLGAIAGTANSLEGLGEWTLFTTTSGTTYLLLMAGYVNSGRTVWTFSPFAYDGTSWTTPAITGLPNVTLGCHPHRNRLWFYNAQTVGTPGKELSAYYLPIGAIAGAVTEFSLGPFATKGGRIVAMKTWTIDGGDGGMDDMAVFVTDEGQAIVYQGTDPASSATWVLVGVFDVGKVASFGSSYFSAATADPYCLVTGDNFAMKYGRDVLIATQNGVTSMNAVLRPLPDGSDFTISRKIRPLLTDAASTFAGAALNASWKMAFAPLLRQLIVSIPTAVTTDTSGSAYSRGWTTVWYVMNTETGAWTKFAGDFANHDLCSIDMVVFGNKLWFIDGTRNVYYYDGSTGIASGTIECRQAYSYLGVPDNKFVSTVIPNVNVSGSGSIGVDVDTDFNPTTTVANTYTFTGSAQTVAPQFSASRYGTVHAAHFVARPTLAVTVKWYSTKFLFSPGRSV